MTEENKDPALSAEERARQICEYLGITKEDWEKACQKRSELGTLLPSTIKTRAKQICGDLGLEEADWKKACRKQPELLSLLPKAIKSHADENSKALGYTLEEWVKVCKKAPQLFEVKSETLTRHASENMKLLDIDLEKWRKLCKQEAALAITNRDTLERTMAINARALDVTPEQWRDCCLERGALLLYRPQVLLQKIHRFTGYLARPESLLKAYKKIPEYARAIVKKAPRRVPELIDYTTRRFVQHPILLICSPEKLAYSYIMLSEEMKSFGSTLNEADLYSYLNTSAERLALGHYYACWAKRQGREVGLYHLAGASEEEIEKVLGKVPGVVTNQGRKVMMDTYAQNCPILKTVNTKYKPLLLGRLITALRQKASTK